MRKLLPSLPGILFSCLVLSAGAQTNLTVTICSGQSYSVGNFNYTATGMYQVILIGSNGLDSIVNLNLTVLPPVQNNISATICSGQSYYVGNFTYAATGQYQAMLVAPNGCDSIVNLNLTVLPPVQKNISAIICSGQSYHVGNFTYAATGQYQALLITPDGCDSIVNLNLTVLPPIQNNIKKVICTGQSWQVGSSVYTTTGFYQNFLTTPGGCDSIVNLDLTVLPPIQQTLTATVCNGDSYMVGDSVYSASGTYQNVLISYFGCDSTVTLNLSVLPPIMTTLTESICKGQSFALGDSAYSVSGIYQQMFTTAAGCDSAVTLNLSVLPPIMTTLTESICAFALGDSAYSVSGTYQQMFTTAAGCDSAVTLNLSVLPPIQTHVSATICEGGAYVFGDSTYSIPGTYQNLLTTANGCDSLVILDLATSQAMSVTPQISSPVCKNQTGEITLEVNGGSAPYLYSLNGIQFQDQPSFFNLQPGIYTMAVQDSNGCTASVSATVDVPPVLGLFFPDSILTIDSGDSLFLHPAANFAVDSFFWQPVSGLDCPTCWEPSAKPVKTTVYQLFAYSEDGCEETAAVQIVVHSNRRIYIPNIFKPDQDGLSDTFILYSNGQVERITQMSIFDRWGNEVFSDKNLMPNALGAGWDGRYKGKPMSPGVYVYYFEVLFKDGTSDKYSGDVTLVR